jgi:predicted transposase YbfD/YdcC
MSFITHFEKLPDPRSHINLEHELLDILFLVIAATLSGAEGWAGIHRFGQLKLDWLRKFRPFANGIPVDDTIARVIRALNPDAFLHCFINWVNELRVSGGQEQIAIDGKTLRRSFDGERQTALHMITVFSREQGLVLMQAKSAGKKNEQQTVLEVLEMLEIKGALITVDAMNAQKKIAERIHAKQANYLLCIKDNHPHLREALVDFAHWRRQQAPTTTAEYDEQIDSDHGRVEVRRSWQWLLNGHVLEAREWAGAQSLVMVQRERHRNGKLEQETQYYLSTLPVDAKRAADAVRGHWTVENQVHWVLDVTFREDDSRIRRGHGPENIAALRRFVLNLARLSPKKTSMKGKLQEAAWSDQAREALLFG